MVDFSEFESFVEDDGEEVVATLDSLKEKATEAKELEIVIAGIEDELSQIKARHRHLTERDIPSIMSEMGLKKFELEDGTKIQIKEFVSGSLNKAPDLEWAKAWVIENGGEALFKTEISVSFDRGGHNKALSLRSELEDQGYEPKVTDGIHAQTFMSFGREKQAEYNEAIKKGENADEVPFEKLGLFAGKKADLKLPKEKK